MFKIRSRLFCSTLSGDSSTFMKISFDFIVVLREKRKGNSENLLEKHDEARERS